MFAFVMMIGIGFEFLIF